MIIIKISAKENPSLTSISIYPDKNTEIKEIFMKSKKDSSFPVGVPFTFKDRRKFSEIIKNPSIENLKPNISKCILKIGKRGSPIKVLVKRDFDRDMIYSGTIRECYHSDDLNTLHEEPYTDTEYIKYDMLIDINDLEYGCTKCGNNFYKLKEITMAPIKAGVISKKDGLTEWGARHITALLGTIGVAGVIGLLISILGLPTSAQFFHFIEIIIFYSLYTSFDKEKTDIMDIGLIICNKCKNRIIVAVDGLEKIYGVADYIYDQGFYFIDQPVRPARLMPRGHRNNPKHVSKLKENPIFNRGDIKTVAQFK